jgi:hypothetical protein
VCCPGLFKVCTGVSGGFPGAESKPCVCATVECGTEENQPPPNVPCCLGLSQRCEAPIDPDKPSATICICGNPKTDG